MREARPAELDLDEARSAIQSVLSQASGSSENSAPHLGGRLQVVLFAVELEPVRVVTRRPGLHAKEGVVSFGVRAAAVMAVVRRHERGVEGAGDLDELWVRAALIGEPVILQLDEELSRPKMSCRRPASSERSRRVVPQQRLQRRPHQGNRSLRSDPRGALEQLPVDSGLVVVTLEVCGRRQLDKVAIAGVVSARRVRW